MKVSLEQLTDIIGFRILVKDIDECYKTLEYFIASFQLYQGNLRIIFQHQKLININQYALQ